jgi:hypothetical protein
VKRTLTAGFIGAVVLTTMLIAPSAQASTQVHSTRCAMTMTLKYKPALNAGENSNAFAKVMLRVKNCTGGGVKSGHGKGGIEGDLTCTNGVVTGSAIAKGDVNWNTGDRSALNWIFDFDKGQLHGKVVSGLFLNDAVTVMHFAMQPVNGDCSTTPLVRSDLTTDRMRL